MTIILIMDGEFKYCYEEGKKEWRNECEETNKEKYIGPNPQTWMNVCQFEGFKHYFFFDFLTKSGQKT